MALCNELSLATECYVEEKIYKASHHGHLDVKWKFAWVKKSFKETMCVFNSGLLKFHAVAEPRNSGLSAKSREIDKNTRNTAKFARNSTKNMSGQHIWNLSWLLELFTCRKFANLSWIFVTATSKQRTETTRR